MSFRLGTLSISKLLDAQLDLARDVRWAIDITTVDYSVHEVARDIERQKQLVAAGASRTLDSFHLPDKYGISHAADLVPWIAGKLQWQAGPCIEVAKSMWRAAKKYGTPTTWGAVWDKLLVQLDPENLQGEVEAYIARWREAHPRPTNHKGYWGPLVDYPHFQVPR